MLLLKPNCELCDIDLSPSSTQAYICTFECTFCKSCVETVLQNVCPNCGGGFCPRPARPTNEYRPGVSLASSPASTERVNTRYTLEEIKSFSAKIKHLSPEKR